MALKTVVIGAYGHIGSYLVPRLLMAGHEVLAVSRSRQEPYTPKSQWAHVKKVILDRETEERNGSFGKKIAALKPDIVVDLINFEPESAEQMVEALMDNVSHYLYCSSIWAHGSASVVPATEDLPRRPICDYGRKKAETESYLHGRFRSAGFPETVVMPGHITGPGWNFINPCGNFDIEVFGKIARGEEIYLPNFGMETLHHVHADDVAQVFFNSILYRGNALGESFHAVAPAAITMRGFAEAMYGFFGKTPDIIFLPWDQWCEKTRDPGFINSTRSHVLHSDNYSTEKGRRLISYNPRYTILQAAFEGVTWLVDHGMVK